MEKYSMHLVNSVMERAEATCRNLKATNVNMERVVGVGDPKDVICSVAKKLEADTLVMGSHGFGFLKRAILGSVSDHCTKHAGFLVVISYNSILRTQTIIRTFMVLCHRVLFVNLMHAMIDL